MNAEAARLHAQVFGPGAADAADAATDPGIDQHHLADLAVLDLRADRDDFPGRLVAERERQSDAAVGEAQALAAAEIVASFPDMKVRVADAGGLDRNHDLVAGGLRVRQVGFLQGIAESRQLETFHPVVLLGVFFERLFACHVCRREIRRLRSGRLRRKTSGRRQFDVSRYIGLSAISFSFGPGPVHKPSATSRRTSSRRHCTTATVAGVFGRRTVSPTTSVRVSEGETMRRATIAPAATSR